MDYSIPKLRPLGTRVGGICSTGSTATGATYGSCNAGPSVGLDFCSTGGVAASICNIGQEASNKGKGCTNGNSADNQCSAGNNVSTGKEVCWTGSTADISL